MSNLDSMLCLNNFLSKNLFIFVTKDSECDFSFVVSSVVSNSIKNGDFVVIVNLAQSYSHYTHLLLKAGINIKVIRDKEKVHFINFLSEAGDSAANNQTDNPNLLDSTLVNCDDPCCLRNLYKSITNVVKSSCSGRRFILFIDEINILSSLGVGQRAILSFAHYCYSYSIKQSSCLFIGSLNTEMDKENQQLVNYLKHLADINIQVESLQTGYSKDADGKVTVQIKNKGKDSSSYRKQLFKIEDKGAKMLTLGL